MQKRTLLFLAASVIMLMALSGCYQVIYEVHHNPDGSGKFVIETIFTEEFLELMELEMTMEEAKDEILEDMVITEEDLPLYDSNIKSVREEDFIDSTTGSLHHIIEVELNDMLEAFVLEGEDPSETAFTIEQKPDGSYQFTPNVDSGDEMFDDGMDMSEFLGAMEDSFIIWRLHVVDFVSGDEKAVHDPSSNTVTWEIPMADIFTSMEPLNLWAIYRLDDAEVEPPEVIDPTPITPDDEPIEPAPDEEPIAPPPVEEAPEEIIVSPVEEESGLPNWVPITLVAVLCLGLIFVVVVAVVIFLVVKKRKKDGTQNPPGA